MLIAQAMGEYAGTSGMASAIQSGLNRVEAVIGSLSLAQYAVLLVGAALVFVVFGRRRS